MSSVNEIKKGIANGKDIMLSKYSKKELMSKIKALCDAYYVSYFNNDADSFHAAAEMLDDITVITEATYPNVEDYINHCMVNSLNKILNERMPRKYLLFHPEEMSIDVDFHMNLFKDIDKMEAERDIVKRNDKYEG
ncbi:MAG: hypothetical protein J6D47_01475 [Peptostreptococcaceae bacterium]|nr:hypothetical protein [Peptostreptococcaceae bacterium]